MPALPAATLRRQAVRNGVAAAPEVVYLARDLTYVTYVGGEELLEDGITGVHRVPMSEVLARLGRGEITDGETIAALMFALVFLGRIR